MEQKHNVSIRTQTQRLVRSSHLYSFSNVRFYVSSKLLGPKRSHQITMQVEATRCNQITARLLKKHCCCTLECERWLSTIVVGIFIACSEEQLSACEELLC